MARDLELELRTDDHAVIRERIVQKIRDLILHDITRLTTILYRVDVNESKLRAALAHLEDADSAELIAELILEREAEKSASRMEARAKFKNDDEIPEEDKW